MHCKEPGANRMILAFWVTDLRFQLLVSVATEVHQKITIQIQIPDVVMNIDTIHCLLVIYDLLRLFYVGLSSIREIEFL